MMRIEKRVRFLEICSTLGASFTPAEFAEAAGFGSGRAVGAAAKLLRELAEQGFLLRSNGEFSMSALGRREAGISAPIEHEPAAQTIQPTANLTVYACPHTGAVWTAIRGWIYTWDAARSTWFPSHPAP